MIVGNRVFYCQRSTLANIPGSYFERRFGLDRKFAEDVAYVDPNGIPCFFIERDAGLFVRVLKYITRLILNLPDFQQNKELWRDLRLEADFFSLQGLSDLLFVTHTCPFNDGQRRGIFYWLGTNHGKEQYRNPLEMGEVTTGEIKSDGLVHGSSHTTMTLCGCRLATKALNVDARSFDTEWKILDSLDPVYGYSNLWFQRGGENQSSLVIQFTSVAVRPTHLSMRRPTRAREAAVQENNSDQNPFGLEAYVDGEQWDVLSLSKCRSPSANHDNAYTLQAMHSIRYRKRSKELKKELYTDLAERLSRQTWEIQCGVTGGFFKYFRFVPPPGSSSDAAPGAPSSIQPGGAGREIFGDIHES